MDKYVSKNISANLSGEYSQELRDLAKTSAKEALNTTSKRVIQKTAEAAGNLFGNKS